MSDDPDDNDGPTCGVCGEYLRRDSWFSAGGFVCDYCEDEAEQLERQADAQPEPNDEGIF